MKNLLLACMLGLTACSTPAIKGDSNICDDMVAVFEQEFKDRINEANKESEIIASVNYKIVDVKCISNTNTTVDIELFMQVMGLDPRDSKKEMLWCNTILSRFNLVAKGDEVEAKAIFTRVQEMGPCVMN